MIWTHCVIVTKWFSYLSLKYNWEENKQTEVLSINNIKQSTEKMGDLPLFGRLILCSCVTLGLTIGEFFVSNYTHRQGSSNII